MKDAYYFSHDSNARHDIKIKAMIYEFGIAGYGMFWVVIEMLRDSSEYKLPLKPFFYQALSEDVKTPQESVEEWINACINKYELFNKEDGFFYSESLIRRMSMKEELRRKKSEAGKKGMKIRWNSGSSEDDTNNSDEDNNNVITSDNDAITNDNKERKVKESKKNKSQYGEFKKVLLSDEEYKKLLEKFGNQSVLDVWIRKVDEYCEMNGRSYKNHYATILTWSRKEEKKPNESIPDEYYFVEG